MQNYLDLLGHILENGVSKGDRTGTGVKSVFGYQMRFPLAEGFPLLTTKKLHFRSILIELLWFLSGSTNTAFLKRHGCRIWDPWADENGDLGPVYGYQWRSWPRPEGGYIDQIADVLNSLRQDPESRRHLVVAWNPAALDKMALPPCHCLFQFYVAEGRLSCQLYQRSCDVFIGLGFNIASYALLTQMIADQLGFELGDFVWTGGDVHLYNNHLDLARLQMSRSPKPLPKIRIAKAPDLFSYQPEDFVLEGYEAHPHIKAEVAV